MSLVAKLPPLFRSRTASSSETRLESIPIAIRRGDGKCVGETSACNSTSRGRVPSSAARIAEPGAVLRCEISAAEAEGGGLAGAEIGLRHAADFAEEADLTEDNEIVRDRRVLLRRDHRGDDTQIDRRLVHLQSAGDVDVDITREQLAAVLLFQHGEEQRHTIGVDADGHPLRRRKMRRRNERLQFDEQRPRALHRGDHR